MKAHSRPQTLIKVMKIIVVRKFLAGNGVWVRFPSLVHNQTEIPVMSRLKHWSWTATIKSMSLPWNRCNSTCANTLTNLNNMNINLTKSGVSHAIDLTKSGDTQIGINLNWGQPTQVVPQAREVPSTSFFGKLFGSTNQVVENITVNDPKADLDLGCMYELTDGTKGVIQALGNLFGNKTGSPFIYLDKDDRSGSAADGENLVVVKTAGIHRILVFAYIYPNGGGVSDFRTVNGRVKMNVQNGDTINLNLDNPTSGRTFCAIALIQVTDGRVVVSKEEQYFAGHVEADRAYKFGFDWTAGRK